MDTNIAVDFLRSQRKSRPKNERAMFDQQSAVTLIEQLIQDDRDIFFSVVTLKELLQYPYISCEEEERINKVLPMFSTILSVDERIGRIAALYSRESAEYREKHIEDCYIAATASTYPLYTKNPKDFVYVNDSSLTIVVPYDYRRANGIG
ncbi:type II toxin-antitoxin system VapC family toxin [Desulfoscipio geothermicus]|uniref:PIN domain-containing protein n=1 Tax=Desulfoscipio geothermicus DSM 3669 TaxID=1121426 RepID=A0A1I6DNC5_9FIRM|nr:type II toxin-antitoxin system VapC family toxin [Desulfoscipio geothermicus]SFR06896.1 hypothetical protein SAMN05660706_1144 [Desulfoscipio geothermicus DSM 3669]